MSEFKLIIAGSRNFNDYDLLCKEVDIFLKGVLEEEIIIVSGTARGADQLGERYAEEKGYRIERYPANWDLHGKSAYKRNELMADNADALIAFWDGKSRGTKHMIDIAGRYMIYKKVIITE